MSQPEFDDFEGDDFDDEAEGMDGDDDGGDQVGGMQGAPEGSGISPTWTWGSSATVNVDTTSTFGLVKTSQQLAQVSLPEPAVCSVYIQASLRVTDPLADTIGFFTLNLNQGLGRTTIPRQISFAGQPAINAPLEFTLPFLPMHTLNVDAVVTAFKNSVDPTNIIAVDVFMVVSPITRIPQQIQKLQFGMAVPGEADDLDDELRQDLEAEGPTAAQAVAQGRRRVDGSNDHVRRPEPEPEDEPQVERVHPVLLKLIDQLTARHGRPPSKPELRAAVKRFKARQARRLRKVR